MGNYFITMLTFEISEAQPMNYGMLLKGIKKKTYLD